MYAMMSQGQSMRIDCKATMPCCKAPHQVELPTHENWDLLFGTSASTPRTELYTTSFSRPGAFEPSLPSTLSDDDDRAHVFTPVSELSSVTSVSDPVEQQPKPLTAAVYHHALSAMSRCSISSEEEEPRDPAHDLGSIGSQFGALEAGDLSAAFEEDMRELLPSFVQPSLLLSTMLDRDFMGS